MQPLKFMVKCGASSKLHQVLITESGELRLQSHKRDDRQKYDEILALGALGGDSGNLFEEPDAILPTCFKLRDEWERSLKRCQLMSESDSNQAYLYGYVFNTHGGASERIEAPTLRLENLINRSAQGRRPPQWREAIRAIWRRVKTARYKKGANNG